MNVASSIQEPLRQPDRLAVSPAEAARIAGIGRTKLYEALGSGTLPSCKLGTRRLVRVSEIEAWLQRLEAATHPDR
jgi:excisionase family DNA binding protein